MEICNLNYREFKVAVRKKLSEMQENMGNLMSSEKQKNWLKWVIYKRDWNFKKEQNRNSGDEELNKRD